MTRSARPSTLGGILQTLDLRWFDVAHHRFGILRQSSGQVLISNFEVAYSSRFTAYRITLSALARMLGGIVNPICFAALRLITNANFVGCSTGRSAGLAPLRILSTYVAARRSKSRKLTP